MVDDDGGREGTTAPRVKNSRQDRLKSALRENLKRRKMQARERSQKTDMRSDDHDPSPDGELGKGGD